MQYVSVLDHTKQPLMRCQPARARELLKGGKAAVYRRRVWASTSPAQAKLPLKDAAAVNTTRWALYRRLCETGLPVEVGTGGRTKFNRVMQSYEKAHWIDAAYVGSSGTAVYIAPTHVPLLIKATGRGSRQTCRVNQFGFLRTAAKTAQRVHGFQTGDLVRAVVPSGKKVATHLGRVTVRASASFNITTRADTIQGINFRYCTLV